MALFHNLWHRYRTNITHNKASFKDMPTVEEIPTALFQDMSTLRFRTNIKQIKCNDSKLTWLYKERHIGQVTHHLWWITWTLHKCTNIHHFVVQQKCKSSPLKQRMPKGGALTPFLRHGALGPSRGSSSPLDRKGQYNRVCGVLAEHDWTNHCRAIPVFHPHFILPSNTFFFSSLASEAMDFQYRWQASSSSSRPPNSFCWAIYTTTMTRK